MRYFKYFKKFAHYILILILLVLCLSLLRNISRILSANSRLNEAREVLRKLDDEHADLEKEVTNASSQFFVEKQARDKLGLAKEGETVLVLPDDEVLKKLSPRLNNTEEINLPEPNWKKWLKLFI